MHREKRRLDGGPLEKNYFNISDQQVLDALQRNKRVFEHVRGSWYVFNFFIPLGVPYRLEDGTILIVSGTALNIQQEKEARSDRRSNHFFIEDGSILSLLLKNKVEVTHYSNAWYDLDISLAPNETYTLKDGTIVGRHGSGLRIEKKEQQKDEQQ